MSGGRIWAVGVSAKSPSYEGGLLLLLRLLSRRVGGFELGRDVGGGLAHGLNHAGHRLGHGAEALELLEGAEALKLHELPLSAAADAVAGDEIRGGVEDRAGHFDVEGGVPPPRYVPR